MTVKDKQHYFPEGFFSKERPIAKGEDEKLIAKTIIPNRLVYIYNPDPIKFFFWLKPEGLLITNFRFKVHYSNNKSLTKLHILIRSPLLCIDRDDTGITIGNKHQLFFMKNRKGGK